MSQQQQQQQPYYNDRLTYNLFYNKPFRYLIQLYNPAETKLLYTSNGFNPASSNLVVERIGISQAQWDTWSGGITIDDSVYTNIDPDVFDNGMVMKIMFGKTMGSMVNAFYGIVDAVGPIRRGANKLSWVAEAKGFGVVPNYTITNFQRAPPPESMASGAVVSNPSSIPFFANNLVKTVFQDVNIMPLLDYTLEQRMGSNFTLKFISNAVKDFVPGIKSPLVTASALINIIARMSGAIWYVDEYKRLQFRYPEGNNQGIIIKDYYSEDDSGDYVAYITNDSVLTYMDSTKPEDGFAQQLFALAQQTDQIGFNTRAVGFTSLANKNLAFGIIPGISKFSNMTFMLSKIGAGSVATNPAIAKLYGEIITDNNHSPTGTKIADFSIPISVIPDVPTPIVKIDRPEFKDLDYDKLHWIKFYGTGSGDDNTIRIWHDDDKTTPSTENNPRYTAIQFHKDGISNRTYSKANWIVSAQGPQFSIAFATSHNIILEASDQDSIDKWSSGTRPVQAVATIPSMKGLDASSQYLRILVGQTAQKIRNYGNVKVSIPNILIHSGTELQIASDKIRSLSFENNVISTATSVQYDLDVKDFAIGSKHCEVSLRGYVSPV